MNVQLTVEELQQFKGYRQEANRLAAILGELAYQNTLLEAELERVKESVKANAKAQQNQLKALGEKYGDGTIDVDSGIITPAQS